MNSAYDDIIRMPRPRSARHAPMPRISRAAQFAPFAALTGLDDEVQETARLTQPQAEACEERLMLMDEKLHALLEIIRDQPQVTLLCFEADERKSGGAYVRVTGRIRRVDPVSRRILLTDGSAIDMDCVSEIDCAME